MSNTVRKRIIGDKDGYFAIYYRLNYSPQYLFYFLEWNVGHIKGKDIDESQMFDSKDLEYIQTLGKNK